MSERTLKRMQERDKFVYDDHITLVKRPHDGKDYDVVISDNAAIMMYIDEEDMVYMTEQFRPAINQIELCLPAETLDKPHLTSLETMIEGLEEECGRRIKKEQVEYQGRVASSPGHDSEWVDLYIARGKNEYVGQRLGPNENIKIIKKSFDDLYEMAIAGEILGAKTCSLIYREKILRLEVSK